MSFIEEIEKREYIITEKNDSIIMVEKRTDLCDSVIIFHKKYKVIDFFIKPNCLIENIRQISYIYQTYNNLMKEVKEFSELSNYKISYTH